MKRFNYKAKEKETGKVIKGNIQAENEQTAGRLLIDSSAINANWRRLAARYLAPYGCRADPGQSHEGHR